MAGMARLIERVSNNSKDTSRCAGGRGGKFTNPISSNKLAACMRFSQID